jgi:hypothetical protein
MGNSQRPGQTPADAAAVDALYGLDPVVEPGPQTSAGSLEDFVEVRCPYCGESFGTSIDLSAGGQAYVEDCQICCQPIEITVELTQDGQLHAVRAERLDR